MTNNILSTIAKITAVVSFNKTIIRNHEEQKILKENILSQGG